MGSYTARARARVCSERPHSSTSDRRGSSPDSGDSGGIRIGTIALDPCVSVVTPRPMVTTPWYRPWNPAHLGGGRGPVYESALTDSAARALSWALHTSERRGAARGK